MSDNREPTETGKVKALRGVVPGTPFNLLDYAKRHRLRTRNLHDGGSVPPARIPPREKLRQPVYKGSDRWDAIVGYRGYVAMDGGQLCVYLSLGSTRGVNAAIRRIEQLGGTVDQVGDSEVGATLPVGEIKAALRMIRVSRLMPSSPGQSDEVLAVARSKRLKPRGRTAARINATASGVPNHA